MRQRVPARKRGFAKTLRADATDAERALWRLLRSRRFVDIKFRRQVPIGPWIADFVSFEKRLIIEADGSQHADSVNDARRAADLEQRGFEILRFWNNDILLRPRSVANAVFAAVTSTPSPGELRSPPSPTRGEGKKNTETKASA
jgi:very-short-patch-repair endonuclease